MTEDQIEIGRDEETDLAEVRHGLAEYTDDPGKADHFDYTPTAVLHRVYCRRRAEADARRRHDPLRMPPLTLSEFGVLMRRVFPRAVRRKRDYHGRYTWGYSHIIGPESVRSSEQRGIAGRQRPPMDDSFA